MTKTYTITSNGTTITHTVRTCTAVAVSIYKAVKANKASREVEA